MDGTYPELRLEEDYIKQYERDNNYGKGSVWYYEDYYEYFLKHVKDSNEYKKKLDTINEKVEKDRNEAMKFQVGILNKWDISELPCLNFPDGIIESQSMYADKPSVIHIDGGQVSHLE
ncbi:MAG: hypothetical protein GY941_19110 [Planctomycetes bacterium]|nr:hypothetical protein [Planctomycetota bacterium]